LKQTIEKPKRLGYPEPAIIAKMVLKLLSIPTIITLPMSMFLR
jgi:hypothetical protein